MNKKLISEALCQTNMSRSQIADLCAAERNVLHGSIMRTEQERADALLNGKINVANALAVSIRAMRMQLAQMKTDHYEVLRAL